MNATMPTHTEEFHATELGAMMREMRENLGHNLETVSADLRIRLVYLEAIEKGRLEDLPGNVYVSGFLRAYSDYLGLNGEEIVHQFKMAGAGINSKTQLNLPSPVDEGRLPTAQILLVAAVIAAGAYGGWYFVSSQGGDPNETVAKVTDGLSGLVEGAANQTDRAPTKARSDAPVGPASEADAASTENAPVKSAESEASQNGESSGTVAAVAETQIPASAQAAAPSGPTERAVEATSPRVPEAAAEHTEPPPSRILPGNSSDAVRIVIRATADSYVSVRTADNEPLFSKLLRPGDSHAVPSGADLLLETGNAGGLQITVGGKRVPSLGPTGQIRRNIPLDAEWLLSSVN